MNNTEPSFYAIIPGNVRYDKRLCANAKLLYGEITSLTHKEGYCFAGNEYFSNLYEVSDKSISRWIKQLEEAGYIKRDFVYKVGSKEIAQRKIFLSEAIGQKCPDVGTKMSKRGDKNVADNNKLNNNKLNNKDIVPQAVPEIKKEEYDIQPVIENIVQYLNSKAGTNFKPNTPKTVSLIKSRLKEKFTIENFYHVIDIKCHSWLSDLRMKKYLRPSTLFGNKFEEYLQEKITENIFDGIFEEKQLKPWEVGTNEFTGIEQNSRGNLQQLPKPNEKYGYKSFL